MNMRVGAPLAFKTNQIASSQAGKNLNALLYLNPRGEKEQLATSTALECFIRKQELAPGYFDGAKSWIKSTGAYVVGGTAALGVALAALGIGAYALGKAGACALQPECPISLVPYLGEKLAQAMHQALTGAPYTVLGGAAAFCVAGEAASRSTGLNISPVRVVGGGVAIFARDRAVGAADWCSSQDTRRAAEKAQLRQKSHTKMVEEFKSVFNDLTLHLHERYAKADREDDGNELVELKALGHELEAKLPAAREFLKQFELTNDQISDVLKMLEQQVKDLQTDALALKTGPSKGKRNAELLHRALDEEIASLAIPLEIRSLAEEAHRSRMSGFWGALSASASALWTGAKYAVGLTSAGIVSAGAYVFHQGQTSYLAGSTDSALPRNLPPCISSYALLGGAFAIGGISLYQAKQSFDQKQEEVASNHMRVQKMLDSCCKELKQIHIGVAKYVDEIADLHLRAKLTASLEKKMPMIHKEIEELYLGANAAEFLNALKSQDLRMLAALEISTETKSADRV